MFNQYLPDALYEKLPMAYLIAAAFLVISPLNSLRWVAIVSLVLAACLTVHRRSVYRRQRVRSALRDRVSPPSVR